MPSVSVTDLGTQFGISMDEKGISETHVFQGKVRVRTEWGAQSEKAWTLGTNEALRIDVAAKQLNQFSASPRSFVSASRYVDALVEGARATLQIPSRSRLVLWFDAARRLQLDHEDNVISWGDIPFGDNRIEHNAWQTEADQRPRWVRRAGGDQPAVRFEGNSHLMTLPFSSGNDVTLVGVLRASGSRRAGQILNFNGPPSLIFEHQANDVVAGKVLSNRIGESPISGQIVGDLPRGGEPVVVVFSYGHSVNQSALYLDGIRVGQAQAPATAAIDSSKSLGASNLGTENFHGDLSELLVFNSVLPPEQCEQLSNELMDKYGIVRKNGEPKILARPRSGDR